MLRKGHSTPIPLSSLILCSLFVGCADEPLAPEPDVQPAFARPEKAPKPPKPGEAASPEISFAAGCGGDNCLWVADADGGNATAVRPGAWHLHSSWSDQGSGTATDPPPMPSRPEVSPTALPEAAPSGFEGLGGSGSSSPAAWALARTSLIET